MNFSKEIKTSVRYCMIWLMHKHQRAYIQKIMRKNHISNTQIEGEKNFVNKWKKLTTNVDVIYYRCFSRYVGNSPDILSGSISVQYIEPILNPIRLRDYYEDKNIYGKMYPKIWLPKTYLRRMNGIFMDEDYCILKTINDENLLKILEGVDRFIVKPSIDSCSGRGISLFIKKDQRYVSQNGIVLCYDTLIDYYKNDFIIQECISQSTFFSQFNPTSINTIRMAVYRSVTDNQLYVTNVILRIGANGSVVDNAHSGGRFIGINECGGLNKYVCETFGTTAKSFNGINFSQSDFVIPHYEEIKEFAKNVAKEIPHHRLIALDIGIDKDNKPILIEYNIGAFSYWLFQFSGQPALQGFTDEIINYCAAKKNYMLMQIAL